VTLFLWQSSVSLSSALRKSHVGEVFQVGDKCLERYLVEQFEVMTFEKNTTIDALKRTQTFWATNLCKYMTFMQGVATLVREKYEEREVSLKEPSSNDVFIQYS